MNINELHDYLRKEGCTPLDMTKIQPNQLWRYQNFEQLCKNHVDTANDPAVLIQANTRKFHFTYIDDDTLNAFALAYKDVDVIGLNKGTVQVINSYFTKAVNEEIFPWVNTLKSRELLAELLLNMAVEFVILHELGHHFNGHLLANDLLSFRKMRAPNEMELESRAIEMDADAYATTRSFSKYLEQAIEKQIPIVARSKIDLLRYWVFATHSFFFLFESTILDYNKMRLEEYYPRIIRQALNMETSSRIVGIKEMDFLAEYEEVLNESFILAENIFTLIDNDSASVRAVEVTNILDPRVLTYMNEVDDYYQNVLLPKLKPYARHRLYDKTDY
ncbi:hypothetical protein ABH892_004863 [Paenibacillus sp. RC254]|uniref:hypothetical protein n=1 Tax=unclassified Paenibacillus TaxID=185978 RepID=UPI0024BAFDC7|nr:MULTISPECIES: hypothetical protein [unclassified Paenibacillus]